MINLKNIKNQKYSDLKFVEAMFYTLPISFIIGNLVLSLHLLLFIIVSFFVIKKHNLSFKYNKLIFLIIIFFVYLFLSTAIQTPENFNSFVKINNLNLEKLPLENDPTFKSFLLVRFVLLVIAIDTLFFNKILDLKKLFYISLFCTSFVSLDIIIQYLLGFDIFGLKVLSGERYSGPFGDESIAGSYLQRFSLLSFFCFYFLNIKKNNIGKLFLFLVITSHSIAILLSGNRMAVVTFLLGCFLVIIFVKNFRFIMSLSLTAFVAISFLIMANNQVIENRYLTFIEEINLVKHFKIQIDESKEKLKKEDKKIKTSNTRSHFLYGGHGSIYKTSIYMWKTQPLFGYGLKGFRFRCWEILANDEVITNSQKYSCSTHSHNYYLELLAEAGIIGIFLMIAIFIIIIKNSFVYFKNIYKKNNLYFYLFLPIFLTFLLEIWPLKSTGSFFTTWNATFTWTIIAILYAMTCNKKINLKKN